MIKEMDLFRFQLPIAIALDIILKGRKGFSPGGKVPDFILAAIG
jgi:hypothetical protein